MKGQLYSSGVLKGIGKWAIYKVIERRQARGQDVQYTNCRSLAALVMTSRPVEGAFAPEVIGAGLRVRRRGLFSRRDT